jgi:hypothetical protein
MTDEQITRLALDELVAVLVQLRQDIDDWCEDTRQDPPIEFICETVRPQVATALARLGIAEAKIPA